VYSGLAATLTAAALTSSYNIPLKAMVFRPAGRGGVGLAGSGMYAAPGSGENGARRLRREVLLFSSERAAVRPLHAKAFFVIHRVTADKDLLWNEMNREIKTVK
jgi:hypothetical protein